MIRSFCILALVAFAISCGFSIGDTASSKPLTVDELEAVKANPDELASKYNGKKITVVGSVNQTLPDYPGAYDLFGHLTLFLTGSKAGILGCQVSEAEGLNLKSLKKGDVVVVTGTFRYEKLTMVLENCTKATSPK